MAALVTRIERIVTRPTSMDDCRLGAVLLRLKSAHCAANASLLIRARSGWRGEADWEERSFCRLVALVKLMDVGNPRCSMYSMSEGGWTIE